MPIVDLEDWITKIRSRDPMTYEDAYWGERPVGPAVISRLVSEIQTAEDEYVRGKFLELLGEMGDTSAVNVLTRELSHPELNIRRWAVLALEELAFLEALSAASMYRESHSEEFE